MRAVVVVGAVAFLALVGCGSAAQSPPANAISGVTSARAPTPPHPQGRYSFGLSDVACATPRNCAAAGYLLTNTVSRGLLFVEKNGRWSVSEPQLPGILRQGHKSEGVSSVSCPAAGHCVAVGYAASGPQLEPLVFTQQAHGWQETVPALPAGAKGGSLDLASCPKTGNCAVAGTFIDSSGHDEGLLLDESDGRWGPATTAGLPPNGSVTTPGQTPALNGLSCWSPGNCVAVGVYGDTSGSPQGWLLTETHGVWAQGVEAELPANASTQEGSYLYPVIKLGPVSCAQGGDCTAVGGYGDPKSHQIGMLLAGHAGHWARAKTAPLPANAGPNPQQGNAPISPMGSIACPSAGNCSAVGWYLDRHGKYHGLLLGERAGSWSRDELAFPSGARTALGISLDSVVCRSAGNCVAVGSYNPTQKLRPLLVTERNGRWLGSTEPPAPKAAARNYNAVLSAVSCPSPKTCLAVGYTQTADFLDTRGMIVTIRRG